MKTNELNSDTFYGGTKIEKKCGKHFCTKVTFP